MRIWNPYVFDPVGNPIPAEAPPALRVLGGEATASQLADAQNAFAKFCESARLSAVPNAAELGQLPDGTNYRIVTIGPSRFMEIHPKGSSTKDEAKRSGVLLAFETGVVGVQRKFVYTPKGKYNRSNGAWSVSEVAGTFLGTQIGYPNAGGISPTWANNYYSLPKDGTYFVLAPESSAYTYRYGAKMLTWDVETRLVGVSDAGHPVGLFNFPPRLVTRHTYANPGKVDFFPKTVPKVAPAVTLMDSANLLELDTLVPPEVSKGMSVDKTGSRALVTHFYGGEALMPYNGGSPAELNIAYLDAAHGLSAKLMGSGNGYFMLTLVHDGNPERQSYKRQPSCKVIEFVRNGENWIGPMDVFNVELTYECDPKTKWAILDGFPGDVRTILQVHPGALEVNASGYAAKEIETCSPWPPNPDLAICHQSRNSPISYSERWSAKGGGIAFAYYSDSGQRVIAESKSEEKYELDISGSVVSGGTTIGGATVYSHGVVTISGPLSRSSKTTVTLPDGSDLITRDYRVTVHSDSRHESTFDRKVTNTNSFAYIAFEWSVTTDVSYLSRDLRVIDPFLDLICYIEVSYSYQIKSDEKTVYVLDEVQSNSRSRTRRPDLVKPKLIVKCRGRTQVFPFDWDIADRDTVLRASATMQPLTFGYAPDAPESLGLSEQFHSHWLLAPSEILSVAADLGGGSRRAFSQTHGVGLMPDFWLPLVRTYFAKDPVTGAAILVAKNAGDSKYGGLPEPVGLVIDVAGARPLKSVHPSVDLTKFTGAWPA